MESPLSVRIPIQPPRLPPGSSSIRERPPLRSLRSSGRTNPEQPGAWVPQSARAKRWSRLVTTGEKGDSIQFPGTRVPEGSGPCSELSCSSFSRRGVSEGPGSSSSLLLWLIAPVSAAATATPSAPLSTHRAASRPGRHRAGKADGWNPELFQGRKGKL